jgi:hypothetical protein
LLAVIAFAPYRHVKLTSIVEWLACEMEAILA